MWVQPPCMIPCPMISVKLLHCGVFLLPCFLTLFSHTPSTVMPRHEVVMSSRDVVDLVKTYPSKTLWDKSYGKEKEYLQVPRPSHPLKVGALLSWTVRLMFNGNDICTGCHDMCWCTECHPIGRGMCYFTRCRPIGHGMCYRARRCPYVVRLEQSGELSSVKLVIGRVTARYVRYRVGYRAIGSYRTIYAT